MVAGEASGDLLAGAVLQGLRERDPRMRAAGIGGPAMAAQGFDAWWTIDALSVRGYAEVLREYPRLRRMRDELGERLTRWHPDVFVGVDAPDFNLELERRLRGSGLRVAHFISPSIWAWRPGRIHKMARAASHVLLVFPFEEAIYQQAGIPATYVGHPLAHALPLPDRKAARERLGLAEDAEYVALLPGSRPSELQALGRLYVEAAKRIALARPQARFLMPLATRETRQAFERILFEADAQDLPLRSLFGHAHDAMQAADAALIASGTATLEALLLDCPHVISYRVPWLTWQIMKRQALLPWIGLPNILANRTVVPEILQDHATPDALAQAVLALLEDKEARAAQIAEFRIQRARLRRDTPRLIADAIRPFLE